jgi:sodium-dependent dicarboxylate transporter 2/3/5
MTIAKDKAGAAPGADTGEDIHLQKPRKRLNVRRLIFMFLGVGLFCLVFFSPPWSPAVDPNGVEFDLSHQGKAALALFLLAATWWVFEVVPIGVTAITIGVIQAHFLIRDPKIAFTNFMDPSVWFIFGSLTIGMVFTKVGLTKRLAYKMLAVVGERTSMIYLGCFVVTSALTLIMAHTAAAATIFPLLMAIYALYDEEGKRTKFGKGLFMGMAYVAGAGSIITLLGAARGAVAIGFFREVTTGLVESGQLPAGTPTDIGFFQLTWYMFPVGVIMTFVLWAFFMVVYKPEKATIPGLRERARELNSQLGPMSKPEIIALVIVGSVIAVLSLKALMPDSPLGGLHKTAILLTATVLFFLTKILSIRDLEDIPWNIILLFGGAMSIGFCLWETGAAKWLAINWLVLFKTAPGIVFILAMAFFVLIMTNFIMNVAAIAISLPVALVIAPYLSVSGEVVLFASLVTAGMPFLCLVGAAPNAIAYESKQFSSGEFFLVGIPASIILMVVTGLFVWLIWPLMGMPVYTG